MKSKRYTEEQIIGILKENEAVALKPCDTALFLPLEFVNWSGP